MVEIRQAKSEACKIANRLKPSGCDDADVTASHGTGPTRTITKIHHSAGHLKPPAGETSGKVDVNNESRMGKQKGSW
jgi:hypothetical protein